MVLIEFRILRKENILLVVSLPEPTFPGCRKCGEIDIVLYALPQTSISKMYLEAYLIKKSPGNRETGRGTSISPEIRC